MCFFPLLWGVVVLSRSHFRLSSREFLMAAFRALWTFFFLFLFVLLHQPKTIGELTVFSSYFFYCGNFGFLPYFFLIFFLIVIFRLFLKRHYTFKENFVFLMLVLFLTEIFRAFYFQNYLNVYQSLGQPFADIVLMTLLADAVSVNPFSSDSRKKLATAVGKVILPAFAVPFFGVATEFGWGWCAVAAAFFCFLLFCFLFFRKNRPVLYV